MMQLVSCYIITVYVYVMSMHRSVRCVWFPNMFRFSSFCFWEYWVSRYSLCFKEEFQRYFEGLHVFHWSVENYLCARSQLQTQSMRLGNWKVHQEKRNHDWSKKWLQQNSRYAVRLITKGGLLQHHAQRSSVYNGTYKQNLTYRCDKQSSEAQSTRCWLKQSSRKFPGQNTDLFFWINKVCDISFSISEQACLRLCRLHAAWRLCLGSYHTETYGIIHRSLFKLKWI